jgi:electron transport complex protein RnfG
MFAVIGTGLVAITYDATRARIMANEHEALLLKISGLIPADRYNNNLLRDTVEVTAPEELGVRGASTVYLARKGGEPVAAIFAPVAPDGYAGPIKLLVAVYYDGTLAGARVLTHTETPGLGDYIEENRSNWIQGFNGRSLGNPPPQAWKVRRDGGTFDHRTGATITPRAIVKAVRKILEYFVANRDKLFGFRRS